jgi:hypothetical protein
MTITFKELVELEPRLGELLKQIKAEGIVTTYRECWLQRWYGVGGDRQGYKQKMMKLVGWTREDRNPKLINSEAYDIAYRTLSEALPACETCRCKTCSDSKYYVEDMG